MMGHWNGFGWSGMGFGFPVMLLFWILVIVGIAASVRWLLRDSPRGPNAGSPAPPRDKTPLEIVQERYARGEIDRAEYEQMLQDLRR